MRLPVSIIIGFVSLSSITTDLLAKPPQFDLNETKACEAKLRELGVNFKLKKAITDQDECGSPRPLELKSLKDGIKIKSDVDVNVRCATALALANWISEVVTPSAQLHLGAKPSVLYFSTTYKCRRRNSSSSGSYSEHAYANAIDLVGIGFDDGKSMEIKIRAGDSDATRAFQAAIRGGACAYFTTVIGPMTNDAHSDHLHLDLAERKGGYRICE